MRRLVVAIAVVLAGAFGSTSVSANPITPANRPTPLAGATNGVVPKTRLINVAPNCIAAREAGPSLARIFAMARGARISLGAEQCYRTLADEVRFANQANQPGNNPACVASVGRAPNGTPIGRSYHGWGKAVDLIDYRGSLTFSSLGYFYMKAVAGKVGWNHPAFAEPGGSTCPEAWHWEWVGDGGNLHAGTVRGDAVALLPSPDGHGYATVNGLGGLGVHGNFVSHGNAGSIPLSWVVTSAASTPDRNGYWMVGGDGGIFGYGNARFYGSTATFHLNQPVNGIAPTKSGRGYWLLAWDGGIFGFGDARFHGSMGGKRLNAPVVSMAATPTGNGYWLVASDGGIFGFGDARFAGSMGGKRLASPIVGMAATKSGKGYWLVAADGGIFGFGDAKFHGSLAAVHPPSPVVGMVPTKSGNGYWIERADAGVAAYGDAGFYGNG